MPSPEPARAPFRPPGRGAAGAWPAQAGFTLLELLVAMTLVALIMAAVFAGLRMGTRSWDAGELRATRTEEMRLAFGLIGRELRQARALSRFVPQRGTVINFSGEPEAVQFVAPMLDFLGIGGLYWISFELAPVKRKPHLVMRWRPYRTDMEDGPSEEDEVSSLLGSVGSMRVEYYGADRRGGELAWRERWENTTDLPLLVRLSLTVRGQPWPELTVALPAAFSQQPVRGASPLGLPLGDG